MPIQLVSLSRCAEEGPKLRVCIIFGYSAAVGVWVVSHARWMDGSRVWIDPGRCCRRALEGVKC